MNAAILKCMTRIAAGIWLVVSHPAFFLPALLAIGLDFRVYDGQESLRTIGSDGWGYYLHLPAIFIYGDPHLAFLKQPGLPHDILQYRFTDGHWQGLSDQGDGYIDKYSFGPAVLQFPFFLAAVIFGALRDAKINGFEFPFQLANAISAVFYFSLGSFLIYRSARLRNGVMASAIALAVTLLATNLTFYATNDGSYAHVYGFCVLAALVYLTLRQVDSGQTPALSSFVLFGFLMGLAVMVRPTNAVYALLFIVFVQGTEFRTLTIGSIFAFIASAIAASPQMALWYVTAGKIIFYSYRGEGFFFRSPKLGPYLFSIRKGVFFWHPMYLLMIIAVLQQTTKRRLESTVTLSIVGTRPLSRSLLGRLYIWRFVRFQAEHRAFADFGSTVCRRDFPPAAQSPHDMDCSFGCRNADRA